MLEWKYLAEGDFMLQSGAAAHLRHIRCTIIRRSNISKGDTQAKPGVLLPEYILPNPTAGRGKQP